MNDIITAIATPFGTAAISVIRVSGKNSIETINQIFKGPNLEKVKSHTISYGYILDKKDEVVDEVMVSVFRGPRSFTAEDSIEISTHGGILIVQKVLERILELDNVRLAIPGEFSQRAYLNGRIDLIEAESIMDLIEAKNNQAVKIAHAGLSKKTSNLIDELREELLHIIANIEVNIDYPEYDDAVVMTNEIIKPQTISLIKKMEYILSKSYQTQMIKNGIKTAIIGKPNVGKSSLLNALIEEDKAIVTNIAGTTRDIVEASLNLNNITLNLIDTAGIRKTDDVVEKIGIERSKAQIEKAELILLVLDLSEELDELDKELLELTKHKPRIIIGNKQDLKHMWNMENIIYISALKNQNIDKLENEVLSVLSLNQLNDQDFNYLSNARQIQSLKDALDSLKDTIESIDNNMPIDIAVIDLTDAWQILGEITGSIYQDELIDQLFSKFCLGK